MDLFEGFEWDEGKRRSNIAKHDLDFFDAAYVFEGPLLMAPAKTVGGERRWMTIGRLDNFVRGDRFYASRLCGPPDLHAEGEQWRTKTLSRSFQRLS